MYKPEYMGKVIPADDPKKLTDFVTNKYDSFSRAYDVCKSSSESIKDVAPVETEIGSNSFKMKIVADTAVMNSINERNKDASITVEGNVTSAV